MRPTIRARRILPPLLLVLAATAGSARASFFERVGNFPMTIDRLAPDVRSRALGGAVVAVPAGPADVWWNPAALPTGHSLQAQYAPIDWVAGMSLETLALAGEWRNLRLGVARTTENVDAMLVRTPYDPEGTGEFVDTGSRIWTFNAGADLAPWLLPAHPRFNLSFGLSARRLSTFVDTDRTAAWDLDLGLIAARRWQREDLWWRLRAAAMVRNALGSEVEFLGWTGDLQRDLRYGLACEAGLEPRPGRRAPLQALLAYGRLQNLDDWHTNDGDHLGLEVTLFELLSPRLGYADRASASASSWSYGCGLQLAFPRVLPLGARLDYAHEDWGELLDDDWGGWQDLWAFSLYGDL
ncbi:MAG: PorV/PorQ family protein [Candidatus Krumholzibacteriia bacterium]